MSDQDDPVVGHVKKLAAAGIIKTTDIQPHNRKILETITPQEVDALISVHKKYRDATGEDNGGWQIFNYASGE